MAKFSDFKKHSDGGLVADGEIGGLSPAKGGTHTEVTVHHEPPAPKPKKKDKMPFNAVGDGDWNRQRSTVVIPKEHAEGMGIGKHVKVHVQPCDDEEEGEDTGEHQVPVSAHTRKKPAIRRAR